VGGPESERDRVARVFGAYAQDRGRRRAWSAANTGNQLIRAELARAILDAAPPTATSAVLDAGCGAGWWLQRLAAEGVPEPALTGIDILDARVARAAAAVPGAHVIAGDVRALPWPDASFDLVTLLTTLTSLASEADQAAALAEARRVTRPGGAIAIWEPRWPNPRNRSVTPLRRATVTAALGEVATRTLTLAPPLARHVATTPARYRALAALPVLRSHRLYVARA
jgi:ubiquinone/menaquinone biosynthesis C-methylase UbiE